MFFSSFFVRFTKHQHFTSCVYKKQLFNGEDRRALCQALSRGREKKNYEQDSAAPQKRGTNKNTHVVCVLSNKDWEIDT